VFCEKKRCCLRERRYLAVALRGVYPEVIFVKPDYGDIRSRLGEPLWYDRHGVPRYDPFTPDMCGVYARYVALLEIACQACGRRFMVAVDLDGLECFRWNQRGVSVLPTDEEAGVFCYGDPPRHDCVGDTMLSDVCRIVEFWERSQETGWEWARRREREFVYPECGEPAYLECGGPG